MTAYYNEIDKKAAAWLRELIAENLIPPGDVDERSITDVDPNELAGYRQLHFFAGVGGWPIAARLAGWPDDREIVTGSCPCQPFSVAGKGAGTADARHLWPDFFRIIRARRSACVMGEQVAAAVGKDWLLGVRTDMEGIGYAGRGVVVPACAVNAPHRRDRLWFAYGDFTLGHGHGQGLAQRERVTGVPGGEDGTPTGQDVAHTGDMDGRSLEFAEGVRRGERRAEPSLRGGRPAFASASLSCRHVADGQGERGERRQDTSGPNRWHSVKAGGATGDAWDGAKWLICHDGKARRVEPSIRLLVNGIPHRAPLIRGYGNAIAPQIAAEMMAAWLEEFP